MCVPHRTHDTTIYCGVLLILIDCCRPSSRGPAPQTRPHDFWRYINLYVCSSFALCRHQLRASAVRCAAWRSQGQRSAGGRVNAVGLTSILDQGHIFTHRERDRIIHHLSVQNLNLNEIGYLCTFD